MKLATPIAPKLPDDDLYPSGDGEPMAETEIHVLAIMLLYQALEDHIAGHADWYISANMFWYWQQGNANARRAPDIMVVKGVGRLPRRRSFMSWREGGAVPSAIVEVVSEKKWRDDTVDKRQLYEALGVQEYFLFDPEARFLDPPLQGFRRNEAGVYVPLELDEQGRLWSEELQCWLRAEGTMLRVIDGATGQPIPTRLERVAAEKQRADALAAEVVRLRALVEKSGGPSQP